MFHFYTPGKRLSERKLSPYEFARGISGKKCGNFWHHVYLPFEEKFISLKQDISHWYRWKLQSFCTPCKSDLLNCRQRAKQKAENTWVVKDTVCATFAYPVDFAYPQVLEIRIKRLAVISFDPMKYWSEDFAVHKGPNLRQSIKQMPLCKFHHYCTIRKSVLCPSTVPLNFVIAYC